MQNKLTRRISWSFSKTIKKFPFKAYSILEWLIMSSLEEMTLKSLKVYNTNALQPFLSARKKSVYVTFDELAAVWQFLPCLFSVRTIVESCINPILGRKG